MRKIIFGLVFLAVCVYFGSNASAHVLIRDEAKSSSAILHVIPDDDPIAGKRSELIFDIKDKKVDSGVLRILDASTQKQAEVPVIIKGSILSAAYIFPSQGLYTISLETKTLQQTHTYSYSQRVSRGVASSFSEKKSYAWAEVGLISGICVLFLLLFLAISRSRQIRLQSKM